MSSAGRAGGIAAAVVLGVARLAAAASADPAMAAKDLAREAGRSPALIDAVRAQNARKVPLSEIQRVEGTWQVARGLDDTMRALMEGPCAQALRAIEKMSGRVASAALLDNRGAVVCMTGKVPRYFWGETEEFSYAFNDGAGGIFVGKPTFDEGAGEYVVPVAVPVVTGREAIGTINLHLFADR